MNVTMSPEELAAYFDHTQLRAYAVHDDFVKLCRESMDYGFKMVAVNPAQVIRCKELLKGSAVHVGAAIGFPLGQTTIADKMNETRTAIENGSDEIDYVVNITELKEGNYGFIEKEMSSIVEICREHHVTSKVIFENCYLSEKEKEELCRIALSVCPDYIKTSTGFGTGGATLEDIALMKRMTGDKVMIKAAGGVRDLDMALRLIDMGVSRIGSAASVSIVEEYKNKL